MAAFDYTYKGWDKIRPALMKSTGLGEALKAYEQKQVALKAANYVPDVVKGFVEMKAAFGEVETLRTKTIASCGSVFKDCKAALQAANSAQESKRASNIAVTKLNERIAKAGKEVGENARKLDLRLKKSIQTGKDLTEIVKKGLKGDALATALKDIRKIYDHDGDDNPPALDENEMKLIVLREKLKGFFPEIGADLDKLHKANAAQKDDFTAYQTNVRQIRAVLQKLG